MKKFIGILCLLFLFLHASPQTRQEFKEDFDYLWTTIKNNYCYWDKKQTDWDKVKQLYTPIVDTISSKRNFVLLLEKVFYELYDHHASLSTNTEESQRLVPTGTDIWAAFIKGKPIITELRRGFGAEKTGLKPGMEIIAFNNIPITEAIKPLMPMCMKKEDIEAKNFALRLLIAGKHLDNDRKITVLYQNKKSDFFPDRPVNLLTQPFYKQDIESNIYKSNIGYIRINNQLGDNGFIHLFDSVLQNLKNTRALILDLRETPSGGNTTVARAILGSFITKEGFYQKHVLSAEEYEFGIKRSWMEIVSPRTFVYTKPLIVLANHWTGSVAEAIVIGFDALKRATIAGTALAGLNGAIYSFIMPHSQIGFSIPVEKVFHVNGSPREKFLPAFQVDLTKQKTGEDLLLNAVLKRAAGHE